METYVALLRGINVGGNTIISMAKLKESFESLGYQNVKTYINSGNIIFNHSSKDTVELESQIEKMIVKDFSLQVRVVVRSLEQYEDILRDLHPKPGIEEVQYHPGVVFWAAKTSDLTKSNMIKLSKSALYKEMTVRNLNTTRKIYSMMCEVA
jgi:uncharacterized protein (DUF1697 family)